MLERLILEILSSLLLSLFAGRLLFFELKPAARQILRLIKKTRRPKSIGPYSTRIEALTGNLASASSEADRILQEMTDITRQRAGAISHLEAQLLSLSNEEQGLQEKIRSLEQVPIPAVEHFIAEIKKGEKRSARRDYALFGLGVFVSTVVAVILKVLFGI